MLKIRQINQGDNSAVKNLISSIMRDEFIESARGYTTDDLENTCEHYSGKNEIFYVAEGSEGHIVGTVGIKYDTHHTALLRRLFLKKEFRGKGHGSKLIRHALDFCKKHGYKNIIFRGTDAMAGAYKTCLKNGFCEKDILALPHAKMFVLELSI
ncbi:MAG: GNAT family N-acetyltransferase [Elusimicrobia bacterium]|nr:GNAT family N-acetyltransferase [Candidatus Liberimonas magnetica]